MITEPTEMPEMPEMPSIFPSSPASYEEQMELAAKGITAPYQMQSTALGPSKINTYLNCPRSYQFQYLERRDAPSSPAATLGSTVHSAIEMIHREHLTSKDMDEAAEFLMSLWGEVRDSTTDPDDADVAASLELARDEWLPWYLKFIEPQVDIVVEDRWNLEIDGVRLQGTVDRVYREDGGATVISDVKTGKRAPSAQDLNTDLQLSLYTWAVRQQGIHEEHDPVEIVMLRKATTVRTTRTDEYLQHVLDDVVIPAARGIEAGNFPCNPGRKFGCAYCNYQRFCPVGQG